MKSGAIGLVILFECGDAMSHSSTHFDFSCYIILDLTAVKGLNQAHDTRQIRSFWPLDSTAMRVLVGFGGAEPAIC